MTEKDAAAIAPEIFDALYGSGFDDFVEQRKSLAAGAKKESGAERAKKIAALPKPSVSAWAVNQLYRSKGHELADAFDAGTKLRRAVVSAMRGGDAARVAGLQAEHRQSVEAALQATRKILDEAGHAASEAVSARIRTTLTTLSITGSWADAHPGALVKDLDPIDVTALATMVDTEPDDHTKHHPGRREPKHPAKHPPEKEDAPGAEPAKRAHSKAPPKHSTVHEEPKRPSKEEAAAERRAEALREKERALSEAEELAEQAERAARDTERAAESAEKRLETAQRKASELAGKVEELESKLAELKSDLEKLDAERREAKHAAAETKKHAERASGKRDEAKAAETTAARELAKVKGR